MNVLNSTKEEHTWNTVGFSLKYLLQSGNVTLNAHRLEVYFMKTITVSNY